jgi:hypothetical protein
MAGPKSWNALFTTGPMFSAALQSENWGAMNADGARAATMAATVTNTPILWFVALIRPSRAGM